jgi:hypothetical protein
MPASSQKRLFKPFGAPVVIDLDQRKDANRPQRCLLVAHLGQLLTIGGLVMYALIIVIGVLSTDKPAGSAVPIGVTSQIVGKFKNLDECKAAASQPHAAGPVADITVVTTWGANWYCTYAGPN